MIGMAMMCGILLIGLSSGAAAQQVKVENYRGSARVGEMGHVAAFQITLPVVVNNFNEIERGKIAFVSRRDGNDEIYSMAYDGSGVLRLTNDPAVDNGPDWSPDGSKIAFSSNRSGDWNIYVMNADGSSPTQLSMSTGCMSPDWSPDGSRIAFYCRESNNNIIYTIKPDGSDLVPVTDPATSGYDPYWSKNGSQIAFISARTTVGVYVINADGTNQQLLLAVPGIAYFAWSPSNHQLALSFGVAPNYNMDIYVYDLNNLTYTRLTDTQYNHLSVDWSPEGRYLTFHSNRDDINNFEIYMMGADGSPIVNISNDPSDESQPDWSR